jgi:hypothetical protein
MALGWAMHITREGDALDKWVVAVDEEVINHI